jgi:hypothetical protein
MGQLMSRARGRSSSSWRLFIAIAIVLPLSILVVWLRSGPSGPAVVIYGDSLTVLSKHDAHLLPDDPASRIVFRAKGGTAMCDWLEKATKDSRGLKPVRVVLAFTGNTATCVDAAYKKGGAAAAIAVYEQSLRVMRAIFPTLPITIVIPPAMHDRVGWYPLNGDPRLVAMYKRVGAELHMYVNTDADTWLTPGHVFAQDRPDFVTGKLVDVRLSDGIHVSPAGALYYGAALVERQTGDYLRSKTKTRNAAG